MDKIALPPHYVPVPVQVVLARLSPPIKDTYCRLLMLAYDHKFKHTGNLPIKEVLDFLDIERSSFYNHVRILCGMSWLRSSSPRAGFVRFEFPMVENFDELPAVQDSGQESKKLDWLKEEEESIKLFNLPPPHPPQGERVQKVGQFGQIEMLLRASGVPTAQVAEIALLEKLALEDVLAEVARCHDPCSGVRRPDRVIGLNLLKGNPPPATYYDGGIHFIPQAILRRAGIKLEPPAEPDIEPDQDPEEEKMEEQIATPQCLTEPIGPGSTMTAVKAWKAVMDQLQMDVPRTSFEMYIGGSRLVDYKDGVFIVATSNNFARMWMEGRLISKITRLLSGVCNAHMEVKFVREGNDEQ